MSDISGDIKNYIAQNLLFDAEARIDGSASLLDTGTLDSTGVMDLVAFLETTYGIEIADEELVPENLDSVDKIVSYIDRKRVKANI